MHAVRIAECEQSTPMSVHVRITVLYRRPPTQMDKKENDLHSHHHKAVTRALETRCMLMHIKTALWSLQLQAVRIAECERSTSMSVPVRITVLYRRPPTHMHKKENDLHRHHHKVVKSAVETHDVCLCIVGTVQS